MDELDHDQFTTYLKGLEIIKARETLEQWSSNDWPHLKKDRRQQMHRKIHRIAYPNQKAVAMTHEQLAKFMGLGKL